MQFKEKQYLNYEICILHICTYVENYKKKLYFNLALGHRTDSKMNTLKHEEKTESIIIVIGPVQPFRWFIKYVGTSKQKRIIFIWPWNGSVAQKFY